MRNKHEGKENHLLELCSGRSQMWVFVTVLPKHLWLSQQQHVTLNSILGKNSSLLTTGHCNKPFPAGLEPLGDPTDAPGILCAIKTPCAIKITNASWKSELPRSQIYSKSLFLFSLGAQLNLGNLSLQYQKCKWKKTCLMLPSI